jgi:pyridoxine/pyridoxamine 5'-phosphate oxidase
MPAPFPLASLKECFEGVMPAVIATVAGDGTPNVTYLSKVIYVDEQHVALSNQFFSKTVKNVRDNPQAQITVLNPQNGRQARLDVRFVRAETSGELFEQLRAEIDAIASMMGMQGIFRLHSADVYAVTHGELVMCDLDG